MQEASQSSSSQEERSSENENKQSPSTLDGYVHLISQIKTGSNAKTKYFDMKVQTSEKNAVRAVCYSPEKRIGLQQCQSKKTPVMITAVRKNAVKRFCSFEEYTIPKQSKISPTELNFPFNCDFSNRLHTLNEALAADLYETVDIKVKIMTKEENKQTVLHREKTKYKVDTIVADETNSMKLVLWENAIEKVETGKSYKIENCKIRIFDDCKFMNTNEYTKITEIEDIANVNLSTPELENHLVTGVCLGVDVKTSITICLACNAPLAEPETGNKTIKCPKCKLTLLVSSLKTKLVCELLMEIEGKMSSYTAFNNGIQSFCRNINYNKTPVDPEELTLKLLNAGPQKLLVDKSAKVICQFLAKD